MMKNKCVACSALLPQGNFQLYGNYCRWCDAKADINKKTNIKWFFEIARALKI